MVDTFTLHERSEIMRRVRSTNTTPEKIVRAFLHRAGFRFRLHRADLPGKPDIVLPKYRTVIFINGCFWHRHHGCSRASTPASRQEYWIPKFRRTVERDQQNYAALRQSGWTVIIVWECELKNQSSLQTALLQRLTQSTPLHT